VFFFVAINGRSSTEGHQYLDTQRFAGCLLDWCRGGAITEARQGFGATGLHKGAFSRQHSAVSPKTQPKVSPRRRGGAEKGKKDRQTTAEGACATRVSQTLQQMKRDHFLLDSKQKVKYHHLIPIRRRRRLRHCHWDTPGM
jgi:hypothetical protein